jgi:hypothetical protein
MKSDLQSGILKPVLELVQRDRDLLLEFRGDGADIYYKGHCLNIRPSHSGYQISAHAKFLAEPIPVDALAGRLPGIKQAMAEHRCGGAEIEFDQALIRANNLEPTFNTDYFFVDRQVGLSREERPDALGIYWPRKGRQNDKEVSLALIEVKWGLNGGVEKIAEQVERYYKHLKDDIVAIATEAETLLRQKLDLKLITGAQPDALRKLRALPVSRDITKARIVLALIDYNPNSTKFDMQKLNQLPFADQVVVFHLGLCMWDENAEDPPFAQGASA